MQDLQIFLSLQLMTLSASPQKIQEGSYFLTLGVQRELNIPLEKLNIRGGAIALGHPYSATGVNLAAKAAGIFARNDFERCAITMCCGGGQGVAAIFEKCD